MRIEAGQLDRAAVLADDISRLAERYGFDLWRLDADICRAAVNGLAALGAQDQRKTDLAVHIATLTTRLDTARRLGITRFGAFYDAILGRLLIAAGHPETAHARLDASLHSARDTGIRFYDAELLRLRAQTHGDRAARQADIDAALEVSRRQGATLFELRAALDDYDHRGRNRPHRPSRHRWAHAYGQHPARDNACPCGSRVTDGQPAPCPRPIGNGPSSTLERSSYTTSSACSTTTRQASRYGDRPRPIRQRQTKEKRETLGPEGRRANSGRRSRRRLASGSVR